MESEKPLPLGALIGCLISMMSSFVAYLLSRTVFSQGMQILANAAALVLLIVGIVLTYLSLRRIE